MNNVSALLAVARAVALSCTFCTVASDALAAAAVGAKLSQVTIELIDLDPADGITPAMFFDSGSDLSAGVLVQASNDATGFYAYDGVDGYGSKSREYPGGMARASSFAGALDSEVRADAGGLAVAASSAWTLDFRLTAHTAALLTAQASAFSEVEGRNGVGLAIAQGNLDGGATQFDSVGTVGDVDYRQGPLMLELRSGAVEANGWFFVATDAYVTAIPEPHVYAMLLAGIGVLLAAGSSTRFARPGASLSVRA